jgi:UDP-N-acetylglucosamine acyltransferase
MIHPSAMVHPEARLAATVSVGAHSIVGEHVEIGDDTVIGAHVVIEGHTRIGKGNRIFQFCSVGAEPQDKKYAGEPTRLEIGDNNTIRESCTFNVGTAQDVGVTRFGSNNWVMAYVHVAHDCQIGDNVILANSTQLAGHVHVGDYAILGAFTGAHQFCKIGAHVITGGGSIVFKDIPPYITASGYPVEPHGINSEGLKRRGFSSEQIAAIKRAYKTLYRSELSLEEARAALLQQAAEHPEIKVMVDFIDHADRGIIR